MAMPWQMLLVAVTTLAVSQTAQAEEADSLLLRKCTTCHTATRWQTSRHTWPGWWWLTARMRWINGASLDWREHLEVVDRLAAQYPADTETAREEWFTVALFFVASLGLPAWWLSRRRTLRAKRG